MMDPSALQRLLGRAAAAREGAGAAGDQPTPDNGEVIHISSLALLKMLKHGRAGVPMEVMGLMLGEFVDEYTIQVVDVFAMPQSGTTVSVESVDHVFQTKMLEMLKQTGRPEMVVGWYHSHPGFGCWLSSVDIHTQQTFEMMNSRAVAVVVDPIQSVKGKVVIDAFRTIPSTTVVMGVEPRQTTSNIGHIKKPSIQALIHGLNRHYYSIAVNYRKTELEQTMLMNLHKQNWTNGLKLRDFCDHKTNNEKAIKSMLSLSESYNKSVQEEMTMTPEQLKTRHVGKQDPKRHLENAVETAMGDQVSISSSIINANRRPLCYRFGNFEAFSFATTALGCGIEFAPCPRAECKRPLHIIWPLLRLDPICSTSRTMLDLVTHSALLSDTPD
ncbi:multicatalytic endopeptidase [Serendipita sp. 398]|nr:multicatalytic endopeptidase [Serendipita sp. 398]